MAIGGGEFKAAVFHLQVDTREDLFGLVGTAGKQGAAQALHQGLAAEQDRLAVLHQGQFREILSGHPPHLIAAGKGRQLGLFLTLRTGKC